MKKTILLLSITILLVNVLLAQEDKTVTLTVSGQGQTQDEAKQNALRNAIEEAFGTFISSNTEILNDELVKDEVVSVSNGNIQKFEILSEIKLKNGGYSTSLKATVSVTKLTSFCNNKGITVEFKGSLFAFNINQQILNEKNEIKAIRDLCQVMRAIADVSFDFKIRTLDPIALNSSNSKWRIPISVSVYKNDNFIKIPKILYSTLKSMSMSFDEARNYINLGKEVYPISFADNSSDYSYIILRQELSIKTLLYSLYYFNHSLQNFKISNGIDEWLMKDHPENIKYIYEGGPGNGGFQLFLGGNFFGEDIDAEDLSSGEWIGENYDDVIMKKSAEDCCYQRGRCLDYKQYYNSVNNNIDKYYIKTFSDIEDLESLMSYKSEIQFLWQPKFRFITKLYSDLKKDLGWNNLGFKKPILNGNMGLVISFIDNPYKRSWKDRFGSGERYINNAIEEKELIRFYFDDIRDINEINKISEYKVLPINK